jgi:protein involved in polysaccharide export with SLBB domain
MKTANHWNFVTRWTVSWFGALAIAAVALCVTIAPVGAQVVGGVDSTLAAADGINAPAGWLTTANKAPVGDSPGSGDGSSGAPADSSGSGAVSSAVAPAPGAPISLTPAQIEQARSMIAGGGAASPDTLQRLCAGVAAKHLSAEQIESTAASLGLSGEQVSELKNCATSAGAALPAEASPPASASGPSLGSGAAPPPTSASSGGMSSIESSFRSLAAPTQHVRNPTPANLQQFGYALFNAPVSTFAPVGDVPVQADYILGPGDGLNLLLWGRVNRTDHLKVERDGSVLLPDIGPVDVSGLTFEQAKKLIESRAGQITGVQVDVTMGPIRTIQVFVIGKVEHPGLFTISALSHVSNALVAAGGISKIGSLRRIEVRRGNQLLREIDIYDMLLHGNTSADVRLEQGDVIFVPVIGSVVGVTGDVKEPAIYELKGQEDLAAVLRMAGGVSAFGYSQRVQVERIDNHERRVDIDVRGRSNSFGVRDGDLVKVFTVLPERNNVVTLKGNARRPGTYQWRLDMRVTDLINEGEGVADHTYFGYALIRRVEGPDRRVRFMPVDLGAALRDPTSRQANIVLEARDELTVYAESDIGDLPKVRITGAVRKPGSYPLSAGMRVSDLVYEAGGVKESAYLNRAELARVKVIDGTTRFLYQDVALGSLLDGVGGEDPALQTNDELYVVEASNWHQPWTALVEGEVMRPGPYVIRDGERLDSLLQRCGGLRSEGYLQATVFIRQSVQEMEQKQLNESRQRLQADAARLSIMPKSPNMANNDQQTLEVVQRVLTDTQSQQATGRVVLHLWSLDQLAQTQDDIVLQQGDKIIVPKRPATVAILGQVYNPSSIVYEPGRTVNDYLQRSGGPTQWADPEHIMLIRANGDILTDDSVRHSGKGALFPLLPTISGGLMGVEIDRGDTIYVPETLRYIDKLQETKDITQIVVNSATALAVIGILATSL